jgi:hypothetical protein
MSNLRLNSIFLGVSNLSTTHQQEKRRLHFWLLNLLMFLSKYLSEHFRRRERLSFWVINIFIQPDRKFGIQ